MSVKIITCSCDHSYQNQKYGNGKRVANQMKNGNFRCTVCGKIHDK
jgi:hypothetical protein